MKHLYYLRNRKIIFDVTFDIWLVPTQKSNS